MAGGGFSQQRPAVHWRCCVGVLHIRIVSEWYWATMIACLGSAEGIVAPHKGDTLDALLAADDRGYIAGIGCVTSA